jgi:hypothetical protein
MGLFSYVKLELPCPYCSHLLKDFQSKDGILMEENEPWTLRNFYTKCPKCTNWVEYIRKGTELSSINLIDEGKQAVSLLREYKSKEDALLVDPDDTNYFSICAGSSLYESIENFLKNCHYPADDTNWMDWYDLKKND